MNRLESAVAGLESAVAEFVAAITDELARATRVESLLTVAAAAERIGMSEKFVRSAIKDGRLASKHFGGAVRVAPADVDALGVTRAPRAPRARQSSADTPTARAAAALHRMNEPVRGRR